MQNKFLILAAIFSCIFHVNAFSDTQIQNPPTFETSRIETRKEANENIKFILEGTDRNSPVQTEATVCLGKTFSQDRFGRAIQVTITKISQNDYSIDYLYSKMLEVKTKDTVSYRNESVSGTVIAQSDKSVLLIKEAELELSIVLKRD